MPGPPAATTETGTCGCGDMSARCQRSKIYRDSRSSGSLIPCSAISTTPFGGFGLSQKWTATTRVCP